MGGVGMGWFWVWPVLVLIGLVLLGYLGYVLVRNRGHTAAVSGPASAREVLDQRYARGEIDESDYRERREALQ